MRHTGAGGVLARLEGSARIIASVKLTNVALILLWGFAVTFVFVRALPLAEFQSFLLLVAFGNFTISAEFGLTSIIYARLRRFWLGVGLDGGLDGGLGDDGTEDEGAFRLEEMGILFLFLGILIIGATLILIMAMAMGWLRTSVPLLFLLFFLSACLNLPALLAKRALAASDGNLIWEGLDCGRRIVTIGLLLAVLAGLDLRLSVALQLAVSVAVIGWAIILLHRRLAMRARHWFAFRVGGGHVRAHYLRDIGASVAFTLSEIIAYNGPYFTIALATSDARPMLLFDFLFKMSRALSMTVRAVVEAALPRITRAYHARDADRFDQLVRRAMGAGLLIAVAACAALLLLGRWIFFTLFNGKASIGMMEIGLVCLALAALCIICVSVYVQAALGRFATLLGRSIPFLIGSLVSVPLALSIVSHRFDDAFLLFYTLTLTGTAALHGLSLRGLSRDVRGRA